MGHFYHTFCPRVKRCVFDATGGWGQGTCNLCPVSQPASDTEPPSTAEDLRDWLRALKKQSRLSFDDLAQATGESARNIKRWMTAEGDPVIPSGDALLKLLAALGVTLSDPPPHSVSAVNRELQRISDMLEAVSMAPITDQQRQVLVSVAEGKSNEEIAETLGISGAEVRVLLARAASRIGRPLSGVDVTQLDSPAIAQGKRSEEAAADDSGPSGLSLAELEAAVAALTREVRLGFQRIGKRLDARDQPQPAEEQPAPRRARKR